MKRKVNYSYYQLNQIITDICSEMMKDDITSTTNLTEILDSLDAISLIMEIEERFDVIFNDYEVEHLFSRDKITTVNDIVSELFENVKEERKNKIKKILKK